MLAVLVHHWLYPVWPVGHWGVRLFFVISGYLITRTIVGFKAQGWAMWPAARHFFVRRSLRLFPAYYLTVLLGAGLFAEVRQLWPWYVGYLSNLLMALDQRWVALTPSWSLALEEQFYLLWFFVVMLIGHRARLLLLLALLLVAPLVRHDAVARHNLFLLLNLPAQVDALAAGALLFEAERRGWRWPRAMRPSGVFLGAGGVALVLTTASDRLADPAGLLLLSLAVWLARDGFEGLPGRVLGHPVATGLGKISYGIYLYHMVAPALLEWLGASLPGFWHVLTWGLWPTFALRTATTLCLAQLSFRFIEQPARDSSLGRRLAGSAR